MRPFATRRCGGSFGRSSVGNSTRSRPSGTRCAWRTRSRRTRRRWLKDALDAEPARILDVGTGTGAAALRLAQRFPNAQIVGVDLAERMLERARENTPSEVRERVTFQRADASAMPFAGASFDLVTHANMIPFFDEVARVVAPGGHVLFAFSSGEETPIYVDPQRLRTELDQRGFTDFAEFDAGRGNALLARKSGRA